MSLHIGLQVFDFEYDFTSPRLTTWDAVVLQLAGIWNPETSTKNLSKRAKSKVLQLRTLV